MEEFCRPSWATVMPVENSPRLLVPRILNALLSAMVQALPQEEALYHRVQLRDLQRELCTAFKLPCPSDVSRETDLMQHAAELEDHAQDY